MDTKVIALLIGLSLASGSAIAQNVMSDCGCDKFAGGALMTVRTDAKRAERSTFEKSFFCYAREEAVKELYNSYINVGIAVPDFLSADLKNGYSSDRLKTFREQSCAAHAASEDWKSISETFEKFAPPELFQAVNKCVEACKDAGGLYCDLRPLDTENLSFFARWRPTGAVVPALLKTMTVTGGQLVKSSNVGGDDVVKVGMSILPGGISVPVRRNTPFADVRVALNTDQGSCEATQPALTIEYRVKAHIVAHGNIVTAVTQTFTSVDHNTNGDCNKNDSGGETFCFGDGSIKAISIGNFAEASGNCGRRVTPGAVGTPTQNCANANWWIEGCGYNYDIGIVKNCKGNGWITYHASLTGEKVNPAAPSSYEKTDTVRLGPGATGSLTYQFPMEQIASWRDKQLLMNVSILKILQGKEIGTISLNAQTVSQGGATLSFNPPNGQASVTLKNDTTP
jgi:hypothetical protein